MLNFQIMLVAHVAMLCMGCMASPTVKTPTPPQCVSGYEYSTVTGNCYKLHTEEVQWPVAEDTCRREGGHLAVINSREEARVLTDIRNRYYNSCFIGVYRDSANRWTTVTGEDVVTAAGHGVWAEGEPDSGNEWRYGVLLRDATISSRTQYYAISFICERVAAAA